MIGGLEIMKSKWSVVGVIVGCVAVMVFGFGREAIGQEPNAAPPAEPNVQQAAPVPAGPPPAIKFENTIHDFGNISPGSSNTCEFKFCNEGKGALNIAGVSKTCGCTVPELAKKDYAPGECGTLKVTYNADKAAGARSRKLTVNSNDPNNPSVDLTIKAVITQKVAFEPKSLNYTLKGENAGLAELTLRSVDDQPFSITSVKATGDAVTAEFDPAAKATKHVIKTKILPEKMGNSVNGRIEIALTHPECTDILVPFDLLPRFSMNPPSINVLNAKPKEPVQKELWLLNNYEEDFEVEKTESKDGLIKVVSQEKVGNRYKFNLEITPPETASKAKVFTDTLSVTIKGGENVHITCRGFYARQ
jgi:hypothetical protein